MFDRVVEKMICAAGCAVMFCFVFGMFYWAFVDARPVEQPPLSAPTFNYVFPGPVHIMVEPLSDSPPPVGTVYQPQVPQRHTSPEVPTGINEGEEGLISLPKN